MAAIKRILESLSSFLFSVVQGGGSGRCKYKTKCSCPSLSIMERSDKVMSGCRLYLKHNLKICDLAREAGTNRSYMSISIKSVKGQSFNQYVKSYRVGYAKELIRSKKTSTNEEIAIASGFSSARNFTRQFRIIEGTTPSRYRKAIEIGIR